jgi:hypothetical protein
MRANEHSPPNYPVSTQNCPPKVARVVQTRGMGIILDLNVFSQELVNNYKINIFSLLSFDFDVIHGYKA